MRRLPWDIVLALLAGIGVGLVYAWMVSPLSVTDTNPSTLRADFKDQYRSAIAAAYAASGNLPRAQARLALLQDPDPVEALNAQAQQMLAQGDPSQAAAQVASLARVLDEGETLPASNPVTEVPVILEEPPLASSSSPSSELTFVTTETPAIFPTEVDQAAAPTPMPRPVMTDVPTLAAPFKLAAQEETCDPSLPGGLLQVVVLSTNGRQLPGMEIDVTWEGGAEQFFTGLKPELGNGYADFIMAPGVSYTVQLASGSEIATGLVAPSCQADNGGTFNGGLKLTYQRP